MSVYCFKTYRVGVSGSSVCLSTRQYHVVAFGKSEYLFCFLHCMIEHHINGIELLTEDRSNAPAQVQLPPRFQRGGHSDNINRRSETAHHTDGHSRKRADNDPLGFGIYRHCTGSVRNSVNVILDVIGSILIGGVL